MLGVEYVITLRRTIRSQRRSKSRSETTWDSPDWKCCDKKELPFSLMGKVDGHWLKLIYSEKATKFCEIFCPMYLVPVKSKVKISLNFVAFSEYIYELYFVHFFEDEDTYPLTFSYLCVRLPDWNCCYKKDMYIPYIAKKFRF